MSKISIIISPEKEYFISPISEDGNIVVFLSNEQENNVVKIIPENLVEKLKSILITKNEPSLEEAVNVLCKYFKGSETNNGLTPQMLNSKKLEILKSIANSGGIDWDEVKENERIISLQLKTI